MSGRKLEYSSNSTYPSGSWAFSSPIFVLLPESVAPLDILLNLGITQVLPRLLDEFGRAAVGFPPGQGLLTRRDLFVKSVYRLRVLAREY